MGGKREAGTKQEKRVREANEPLLDVKRGFEEEPDSVISEYGLASYLPLHLSSSHTHTHTQAICHPRWTLH